MTSTPGIPREVESALIADDSPVSSGTSVTKALALLEAFRRHNGPLGLTELARETGLPKSTAFRLLAHLEEAGYVERHEKKYRPGWLLFELGTGIDAVLPLGMRRFALPHMADLFAQTHQTVHLGALDGGEIVHVGRMRGAESAMSPIRFGGRGPATCSAMGKIILAHRPPDYVRRVLTGPLPQMTKYSIRAPGILLQQLREAHERGYAVEREETAIGLVSLAVPIQLRNVTIGALALVGRTGSFNEQTNLAPLRRSAERVQKSMTAPEARSGRI